MVSRPASTLRSSEAHKDIVAKLNTMSVATRYPEDVDTLAGEVTRQIARNYLVQTEALLAWLKQDPRLQS